jgi:hypothetical protein
LPGKEDGGPMTAKRSNQPFNRSTTCRPAGESGKTCDIAHPVAALRAPSLRQGSEGRQHGAAARDDGQYAATTPEFSWNRADEDGRRSRIVNLNLQLNMSSRCDTLSL